MKRVYPFVDEQKRGDVGEERRRADSTVSVATATSLSPKAPTASITPKSFALEDTNDAIPLMPLYYVDRKCELARCVSVAYAQPHR